MTSQARNGVQAVARIVILPFGQIMRYSLPISPWAGSSGRKLLVTTGNCSATGIFASRLAPAWEVFP
ncbi:hypothetical protein ebB221 [Aromatoleum aromaticum EbN1]|uniref:Uncharacterized protein n=1 Tax=Aromatoleum aromaticum (strain DSM 19018 / LMG 30748 / EbN1) TaxID=76114 RepID=Q5NZ46_AROAE|nr:hypothetical protein ebB221 [Aromatoleum aromaticum EbN1]